MRINLTKSVTDVSWGPDQPFHLSSSQLQPMSKTTTDIASLSSMQQCITLGVGIKVILKPKSKPESTILQLPDIFCVKPRHTVPQPTTRNVTGVVATHNSVVSNSINTVTSGSTLSLSRSLSCSSDIHSQSTGSTLSANRSISSCSIQSDISTFTNHSDIGHVPIGNVVSQFDAVNLSTGTFDDCFSVHNVIVLASYWLHRVCKQEVPLTFTPNKIGFERRTIQI